MPHTRISLAIVWLLVALLTGLSVSNLGDTSGLALLVLAALVTPALFLRGTGQRFYTTEMGWQAAPPAQGVPPHRKKSAMTGGPNR